MKIQVIIDIITPYVLTDTGYTSNMTLPEIEQWAADRVRSLQVFLKEGGLEPKPVNASFRTKAIHFVPDGEE